MARSMLSGQSCSARLQGVRQTFLVGLSSVDLYIYMVYCHDTLFQLRCEACMSTVLQVFDLSLTAQDLCNEWLLALKVLLRGHQKKQLPSSCGGNSNERKLLHAPRQVLQPMLHIHPLSGPKMWYSERKLCKTGWAAYSLSSHMHH